MRQGDREQGYKRAWYLVLDENDVVIHETYDVEEAHRIADVENGSVEPGTEPVDEKEGAN